MANTLITDARGFLATIMRAHVYDDCRTPAAIVSRRVVRAFIQVRRADAPGPERWPASLAFLAGWPMVEYSPFWPCLSLRRAASPCHAAFAAPCHAAFSMAPISA